MTDEPTASDDVLADLRSKQWPTWHDAALDITAYLDDLKDSLWSELRDEQDPSSSARHSTLCWILTWFDCRGHFRDVFRTAIVGSFEAQNHALSLLHHQFAEVTDDELTAAEEMMSLVDQVATCEAESREILRKELQDIIDRRRRAGTVSSPRE